MVVLLIEPKGHPADDHHEKGGHVNLVHVVAEGALEEHLTDDPREGARGECLLVLALPMTFDGEGGQEDELTQLK